MAVLASPLLTRRHLMLATAASASACSAWLPPAPGPMELLHFDDTGPHTAPAQVVMLPGAYSTPQEFVDEDFIGSLRRQGAHADVVVAGARLEHYIEGPVLQRLHDEVVGPARARGVRQVWLVGISLGGLFALAYAARHPGQVAGVVALAPYLGRRTLWTEVLRAGGPAAWAAARQPQPDDLLEHEVWAWIGRGLPGTALHLGYGRDDRFADAHQVLAPLLPPGRSFSVPGGHDWPVWRTLWQQWLAQGLLPARGVRA